MDLITTLEQVFATNFEVYYRTHVAHVNIVGRNFYSDHKLLEGIYQGLQENIDTLAEFLRTLRAMMPKNLGAIQELSVTNDTEVTGNALTLLQSVYDDLETLIDLYKDLNTVAEEEDHSEIANYAQDQLRLLRKSCWQLRSILEDEDADADYD
tara:strand:+ start:545 stop:1003 length:459 start_codon:yes stop_codon:yes gene_type:complete